MRRMKCILVLLILIYMGIALSATIEIPLTYSDPAKSADRTPFSATKPLEIFTTQPEGNWKLPKFNCSLPLFTMVTLGETKRLVAFDYKSANDKFYTLMYYDENANGDLTDDTPVDGNYQNVWSSHRTSFPANYSKTTWYTLDGVKQECSLYFTCQASELYRIDLANEVPGPRCSMTTGSYYSGIFQLHEKTHNICLVDRNLNGYFGDTLSTTSVTPSGQIFGDGDGFYISDKSKIEYYDGIKIPDYLVLDDTIYEMKINLPARKVILTPYIGETIPVTLNMRAEHLNMLDVDSMKSVGMYRPALQIPVPAGTYQVYEYQLLTEDKKGSLWQIVARGTKDTPLQILSAQGKRSLLFGEPFIVSARIPDYSLETFNQRGGILNVNLFFSGAVHEAITVLSRKAGAASEILLSNSIKSRPKEASYKIIKSTGESVASGTMKYG